MSQLKKFWCHSGFCNEYYSVVSARYLNPRISEPTIISPLTNKKVKCKNNSLGEYVLFCDHSTSFDDVHISARGNNFFCLELKENLMIRIN